jgi:hypothetical protein
MVDISVPEEDTVEQQIPKPWEGNSDLTDEEKAKLSQVFSGEGEEAAPVKEPEQPKPAAEPEITADDIGEEKPAETGRKYKVPLPDGDVEIDESELVKGYMRQADYTRKTQEAARLRAEAEAMREASLYMQPQPTYRQPQVAPTGEIEFATPTEKVLYDELQAVKGAVSGLAQQREQEARQQVFNQIDGAIKGFKEAHADLTDEQIAGVIRIANEEGTKPSQKAFERIYKAEYFDAKKERDAAVAEYVKTLRDKKKAAVAPSAEPAKPAEKPDVRTMSQEDIDKGMAEMLNF